MQDKIINKLKEENINLENQFNDLNEEFSIKIDQFNKSMQLIKEKTYPRKL